MNPRLSLGYLMIRVATLAAALAVAAVAGGCGAGQKDAGSARRGGAARPSPSGAPVDLSVVTARGELLVRRATGGWQAIAAGASARGVREVRALGQGAVVALGRDGRAGRLWLRAGSHARLSRDEHGVLMSLDRGLVRLRAAGAEPALWVAGDRGAARLRGGDVLVERGAGGHIATARTAARPGLAAFSLALEGPARATGVGRMEVGGAAGEASGTVSLDRVTVDIHVEGDMAVTEVDHLFHNASPARREGTFRFPVPDGAMLTGMAMEIEGHMVEGEIVERDKARRTYDEIVDRMRDPALLEWEQGNWFKLRVFPLEPDGDKRIVIRYATPLLRTLDGWEVDYSAAAPDLAGTIGELVVRVDGREVLRRTRLAGGVDVAVPIAAGRVPAVMREERPDGIYTAVRITPDWARLAGGRAAPATGSAGHRRIALVVDTSRSSLEARALELDILKTTLGELDAGDRFLVLASDVGTAAHARDFVPAGPAQVDRALGFVRGIEPDGASDIGAALAAAAGHHPTDVIYIGDGIATWGETDPVKLAAGAQAALGGAPLEAALVGKGASSALWDDLCGQAGGRALMIHRPEDARRFALVAAHAGDGTRLVAARVVAPDASRAVLLPAGPRTLAEGDDLLAVMRTPLGAPVPTSVRLVGRLGGRAVSQEVRIGAARSVKLVAQRWASRQIAAREAAGAPTDEIVALSRDFGVLSRHTSLLVLENDQAYREHQIDRRRAAEAQASADHKAAEGAPQVTGGDLDSLGARRPSISPGDVQPGDPEIRIPAPADARSVVVTLPSGESQPAHYDADTGLWSVRFLVDRDTPDGRYPVRVTITQASGEVSVLHLLTTVDTHAPELKVTVRRVGDALAIRARQVGGGPIDVRRVEVQLPGGQVVRLRRVRWNRFVGRWTPPAGLAGPVTLRVVASDRALNQSATEVTVPAAELGR